MQSDTIYVAGHRGMVGSAMVRMFFAQGIALSQLILRTHAISHTLGCQAHFGLPQGLALLVSAPGRTPPNLE